MIHVHFIGDYKVWFYVEKLWVLDNQRRLCTKNNEFICYFNFNEPGLIQGEIIREDNVPKIFNSMEEAIEYGKSYVKEKFVL